MLDPATIGAAALGAVAGLVSSYVALRRDGREARQQALSEARETIDLLREQTELLTTQGQAREAARRTLEEGWHRREERLEARISDLERDYRSLVLTVTTMGLCANAASCATYNPGDRRRGARPPAAEGDGR